MPLKNKVVFNENMERKDTFYQLILRVLSALLLLSVRNSSGHTRHFVQSSEKIYRRSLFKQ
ncbi:ADS_G0031350.mRNA.1.CDS.1 [Saccharomyces cerevisiae]|nr:ADS_G0031350.mRNA.1.CDS.1 [Saccharomyces cerevisiae]CAI6757981.1 ADS_G0031350.mRNA.1.CDS.1 [Saccharomyces cerevisiae]